MDAFKIGFIEGRRLGGHITNREVGEAHPSWTTDQIELYQNGRDDGVARDYFRFRLMAASARSRVEPVEEAEMVQIQIGRSDRGMDTIDDLVLCRSDRGDGGWSLHAPGSTDEQIASGDAPYLASGPAEWDPQSDCWSRPDANDYRAAMAALTRDQP